MQPGNGNNITRLESRLYLDELVKLHSKTFKDVLSGQIGRHFLKYYYKRIIETGIIYAYVKNGSLCGFVSGIKNDDTLYNIKYYFWAGFGVLSHIYSPAVVKSLFRHLKRAKSFSNITIKPELLSIVVREDMRGKGIGISLVSALEKYFREMEVNTYKVYTDTLYSTGMHLYEKLGFKLLREVNLYGLPLRLYFKNL